jgi:hypothetical protein
MGSLNHSARHLALGTTMEAGAVILALAAPSGDLYWLLGLAILVLLGVVIIRLVRIKEELHGVPGSVAKKLSGGEVARREVCQLAGNCFERLQSLWLPPGSRFWWER